jgi:hypothetical protein
MGPAEATSNRHQRKRASEISVVRNAWKAMRIGHTEPGPRAKKTISAAFTNAEYALRTDVN